MPTGPIIRTGDFHIGHASPTSNPFHRTPYISTQPKVVVNGSTAVRMLVDSTACGDRAVGGSIKVIIAGSGVHRTGDVTSGHQSWLPNAAGPSTNVKVIAG
jgi:uncharacterized Zn-binding protein involved in type VI secretion